VSDVENHLSDSEMFVGFAIHSELLVLLDVGTISQKQHDDFFLAV
jgi:hypothetical protein